MPSSYKINVNAKLAVQGTGVSVRMTPQMGTVVRSLNTGAVVQATERAVISGDPWFHISDGWFSGKFVEGWVNDYDNNNSWWYLQKGYSFPTATWLNISEKDYCFGKDSYLFTYCYIKATDGANYYWVDADGVWLQEFTTPTPDRSRYRVVENYATENAYSGSAPLIDKIYSCNAFLSSSKMAVNALYILNYLRAKGWTKNAICGMLGNLETESTINPGIWQGTEGNINLGFGLTQWTPSKKYFNWAAKKNLYPIDMDSELQRILFEVTTTDPNERQYIPTSKYNFTFTQFTQSTQSAYDLACAFLHNYERPADSNQDATRGNQASKWFNTLP